MIQNINIKVIAMMAVMCTLFTLPAVAQSYKEVTMSVGETQTFYLPSSVTTKNLKSVHFYSTGISYVQVTSYTNRSVTVKAVKAYSLPVIVRCDYRYFVDNGNYTYETSGRYDYRITVVGSGGGGGGVEPKSIRFSSSAVGLSVGESRLLTPIVSPPDAEYTLTWSINDKSVATISQDGLLVGKSEGAADLKVMADNGIYAMLRVVVSAPKPTSVYVTPSSLSMTEGESKYLSAKVYPSEASQSVTWSSSNSSVASVSSTGKVTAIKAGTATITARTSNGVTAGCTVVCTSSTPNILLSDKNGNVNLPSKANVQYERKLYKGWNSICVPFALSQTMLDAFAAGCRIATVVEQEVIGDKKLLSVRELKSVAAGQPCLIYTPKDVDCRFNLSNVSLKSSPDNSACLKGVYQRTVIGPGYYKLADNGCSWGVTNSVDAVVAPYRAYIKLDKNEQIQIEYKITDL